MNSNSPIVYSGRLYFDAEDNYMTVHRLIVREDQIAMQSTATWDGAGLWSVDGIANRSDSDYRTGALHATNQAGVASTAITKLSIRVLAQSPDELELEGTWSESGSEYKFSGELQRAA